MPSPTEGVGKAVEFCFFPSSTSVPGQLKHLEKHKLCHWLHFKFMVTSAQVTLKGAWQSHP